MKIYIPLGDDDPHKISNPFVSTLTDCILSKYPDTIFAYSKDFLWTQECLEFDILHIMWPQVFAEKMRIGCDLTKRLQELKSHDVSIVTTCHNLTPHIHDEISDLSYTIAYQQSNIVIHLGSFSMELLKIKYPDAEHVIIPHHVYDELYANMVPKGEAQKILGISPKLKYILCFGAFRNSEERTMICSLAQKLYHENIRVLAPSFYVVNINDSKHIWKVKNLIRRLYYYIKFRSLRKIGVLTEGRYISDAELPVYFGAADLMLIQRTHILNSGNLPMGMFMGKVVVGPNDGNVGKLLEETGNPVFFPNDKNSIIQAIRSGFAMPEEKGITNKKWIISNCTTAKVAELHVQLYCQSIKSQKIG